MQAVECLRCFGFKSFPFSFLISKTAANERRLKTKTNKQKIAIF